MTSDANEFYKKQSKEIQNAYFKIGRIKCPALGNEYVCFDHVGFRHFFRKGRIIRPSSDQLRRFYLFRSAIKIIASSKTKIEEVRQKGKVNFYALTMENETTSIKIIIRKNEHGKFQYISIMDQNN